MKTISAISKMEAYHKRVKKFLPGGVHYNFRLPWEEVPIHFVNTRGSRVFDMDGNEYLDLYARFGASLLGHGNKEYCKCLKATIDRVLCVSHCDFDAEVLELISKFVPCAEMIRFGLSGTEVVQNALRLARAWTGKNRFIRFQGHYHGNADNIMGGRAPEHGVPIPSDYTGDSKGTEGRARDSLESQSYLLPWNDADILEDVFRKYGDDIAAVITEPINVNGGSIMPIPGYLQKMRELCDQYHVVLIFDEIITGFRMGLGGAQKLFGVTPDLTTLGKAMAGGGIPVSALVGKKEFMQLLVDKKVIHAGTFNGYPLGSAAVKATLEILSRNNSQALVEMDDKMAMMHRILQEEAKAVGLPLIIQGPDACASYHCCEKPLKRASDYTFDIMSIDIILNDCLAKNGILVSTVSRLYPNISLNMDDVEYFRERASSALADAKKIYDEIML